MLNITKEQINEMVSIYEANKEALEELRDALDEDLEAEDGVTDAAASFEQGFNNALEHVFSILGIDENMRSDARITLYDFLCEKQADFDTQDPEFTNIITTCYIDPDDEENNDEYYKFCNSLYKLVKVHEFVQYPNGFNIVLADWSDLIRRNKDAFTSFMEEHWTNSYKEETVFIQEWLGEIHAYLAGMVPSSFYKKLLEFVGTLK